MVDGEPDDVLGKEVDDRHFIQAALNGDLGAFDVLIERYKQMLFVYVYNMIGHKEDTDDILMDTFIRAYQNLHRYKGDGSFSTWLHRIAHNRALDFLRSKKKRKSVIEENWMIENVGAEDEERDFKQFEDKTLEGDVSRKVENRELEIKLNESLSKLSNNHRAVVIMHDIQGKSHAEIAEIMGCSVGTVRSRLHYAHLELRNYLKDFFK